MNPPFKKPRLTVYPTGISVLCGYQFLHARPWSRFDIVFKTLLADEFSMTLSGVVEALFSLLCRAVLLSSVHSLHFHFALLSVMMWLSLKQMKHLFLHHIPIMSSGTVHWIRKCSSLQNTQGYLGFGVWCERLEHPFPPRLSFSLEGPAALAASAADVLFRESSLLYFLVVLFCWRISLRLQLFSQHFSLSAFYKFL